jgi:leucyl aminopeptidase
MNLKFEKKKTELSRADAYIFLCYQDKKLFKKELKQIENLLSIEIYKNSLDDFDGNEGQVKLLYVKNKRIILCSVGLEKKLTLEKIRIACANGIKTAEKCKVKKVFAEILNTNDSKLLLQEIVTAQTESFVLALYRYDKYKTDKDINEVRIKDIVFFTKNDLFEKRISEIQNGIRVGKIIAESTNLSRDLGNEPASMAFPDYLARKIMERGKKCGYTVRVFKLNDIKRLKMGCILAVSKGSEHDPRFVIMKYNGGHNSKPIVLIGKGVTFDSGGINIKPSAGMEMMKMDMSGAAAVIGAFDAVSQMKLKVNLVGLLPLVENMPSGEAVKPGDIVRSYSGKTVEIRNTDAEGRLILSDALAYASKFDPKYVVDIATLTGASIIALGHFAIATVGNDPELTKKLIESGNQTHERIWELPLWDEYIKLMDSENADVNNTGPSKQAGSILGGAFLKRFIGDYSWSHLDIAGTAISNSVKEYIPKYATGVGVRLLTRFILNEIRK